MEEVEELKFELNPEYRDGRYHINAFEKKIHPALCNNHKNAHRRWRNNKTRLENNEELNDGYWPNMH